MVAARHAQLGIVLALLGAPAVLSQTTGRSFDADDPRYGLLTPIPDRGSVPPIVEMMHGPTEAQLAFRAASRDYARRIRGIRHEYLGDIRVESIRSAGIAALLRLEDPAAFKPMIEELRREKDGVRQAVLEHFAAHGDEGQAALAWMAIHEEDSAIRHEALRRLTEPVSDPVLRVLDGGLRSPTHEIANRAGTVSGALGAVQTIPLLIFAQATADPVQNEGDLAWIAVGTTRSFIARLEPVVGSGAGAFQPIPGVIQDGAILRVVDAVAIFYRTEVHRSLVSMTTQDWGRSTADLGYDIRAWWEWYNTEYLSFKNEQIMQARLAGKAGEPGDG